MCLDSPVILSCLYLLVALPTNFQLHLICHGRLFYLLWPSWCITFHFSFVLIHFLNVCVPTSELLIGKKSTELFYLTCKVNILKPVIFEQSMRQSWTNWRDGYPLVCCSQDICVKLYMRETGLAICTLCALARRRLITYPLSTWKPALCIVPDGLVYALQKNETGLEMDDA